MYVKKFKYIKVEDKLKKEVEDCWNPMLLPSQTTARKLRIHL